MTSIRDAALQLTTALESLQIIYAIGGSFASSVHGVARPTQDLDIVAAVLPQHADPLAAALEPDFYVDRDSIREAIRDRRSFNVIHFGSGLKIDIFPASSHDLGPQQLQRRRLTQSEILGGLPASLPVISAEDTLLVKLRWYRDGGESSERQWNDLRNILTVQGEHLDRAYLHEWALQLNVADLLATLFAGSK